MMDTVDEIHRQIDYYNREHLKSANCVFLTASAFLDVLSFMRQQLIRSESRREINQNCFRIAKYIAEGRSDKAISYINDWYAGSKFLGLELIVASLASRSKFVHVTRVETLN